MRIPEYVGDWHIINEIGSGDFATVYLVEGDGGKAALKACTAENGPTIERLRVEAESLKTLSHPNIPRLLGEGIIDGYPYFVMSFVKGKTIKDGVDENRTRGRLYGDIEALQLLIKLLEALEHVHSHRLVHRDIKDANIVHDSECQSLSLIDFGFCKRAGTSSLRSSDSFWRAGAARFSPTSKLENPGFAEPAHDVFAVGVVAYRMLTGEFPWSVTAGDDVAALKTAQNNDPLEPVQSLNSYVWPSVSAWVSRLLDLDDGRRPTASDALEKARDLLSEIRDVPSDRVRRGPARLHYPHVVRDPIHHDIRITAQEYRVINTPQMQRLRYVKQLGLTNLVYPGAEHSRLSHSMGTLARVEQMMRTMEEQEGINIPAELRLAARMYALTHDVTHIPCGHTIEDELGLFSRHDENLVRLDRLVSSTESQLGKELRSTGPGLVALELLRASESSTQTIITDLVSSVTGADVLDYIDRDAYFCGLEHRIDSAIFRQFRLGATSHADDSRLISLVGGKYGLRIDRELAVVTILKERYAMFLKVYTHSVKTAASALLGKALYRAIKRGSLRGSQLLREEQFDWFGDETLLDRLCNFSIPTVSRAANQIRVRDLPHGVYRAEMLGNQSRNAQAYADRQQWLADQGLTDPRSRAEVEQELAEAAKLDESQVIVYCPPKAPGYRQVEHWVVEDDDRSRSKQVQRVDLGDVGREHLGLWELWVFAANVDDEKKRQRLAAFAQDRFGMANMINVNRRQGRL
ncbi:protein kinase [Streptomyces sp. NPDC060187]|uniref:protein kinase domain-containing protein n=1 Tax=Streptomyces sp. NPDC060187 TaxID=3347067 RepID=UPI00365E37BA